MISIKNISLGALALIFTSLSFSSCSSDDKDVYAYGEPIAYDWSLAADSATNALINKFWNEDGNYFNYANDSKNLEFHYWPNAHAMDVLVDAYLRTNDSKYSAYFDKWLAGIKVKNGNKYKNDYIDDMEWNALTMLRIYNITKDQKYLDTTLELWGYIIGQWSDVQGGGIRWTVEDGKTFTKNACSNGPAAILAARLYKLTKDEVYLDWAKKIYDWEKQTLVISSTGEVKDNIICEGSDAGTVSGVALTYNEGTYLGAGVELYDITKDVVYLNDARRTAIYTVSNLVSNNILRNEGEGDNGLFKGIFIRYFLELIQVKDLDESYRTKFVNILQNNAYSAWTSGVNKIGTYDDILMFGPSWESAPIGQTQLTSQASGCMLIEAKAAYELSLKK